MNLWDLKAPLYKWFRSPWPLNQIHTNELRQIQQLIKRVPELSGWGLDMACGSGDSMELLPEPLFKLGSDKSISMVQKSHQKNHSVIASDALHQAVCSNSISFVTVIGLSEYIKDLPLLFIECKRCLLPGGYLLLTSSPPSWFTFLRSVGVNRIHARSVAAIQSLAHESGFTTISYKHAFSQDAFLFKRNTEN